MSYVCWKIKKILKNSFPIIKKVSYYKIFLASYLLEFNLLSYYMRSDIHGEEVTTNG